MHFERQSRLTWLGALLVWAAGCAHVPQEAVTLSEEMTLRIRNARKAHLAMLDVYMDQRRESIDAFLETRWIPEFLRKGVRASGVVDSILAAQDEAERGQIILEFAADASELIRQRRATLYRDLDEIDRLLREPIEEHYEQMVTVSQALTAHLRSAADVTSTRDELLAQLRLEPRQIVPLDEVNAVLEEVIGYEGKFEELEELLERAKGILVGDN